MLLCLHSVRYLPPEPLSDGGFAMTFSCERPLIRRADVIIDAGGDHLRTKLLLPRCPATCVMFGDFHHSDGFLCACRSRLRAINGQPLRCHRFRQQTRHLTASRTLARAARSTYGLSNPAPACSYNGGQGPTPGEHHDKVGDVVAEFRKATSPRQ